MAHRRIQRHRVKGWRMPPGAVYVGRGTPWGNPYQIGMTSPDHPGRMHVMGKHGIVRAFRGYAGRKLEHDEEWLAPLRGKSLACWCPLDQPCHADVLLELANAPLRCEGVGADA